MSRANLVTVRRIVYDNLAVSTQGYGSLDTSNKRFRKEFIDDAIAFADIRVVNILLKAKQDNVLVELHQTQTGIASGSSINQNWALVYVMDSTSNKRSKEIDWDTYDLIKDGGIFDTTNYRGYHTFKDGKIYTVMAGNCSLTYINLAHPVSLADLKSPSGFENIVADFASAHLLMKRLDKPEEAKFYEETAYRFLTEYGIPESSEQETTN